MSQNAIKLSEWAKQKGLTYKGAWRMYRAGDLPCHSEQLPSGTILIYPDQLSKALGKDRVALYARVSPSDTDADLEQQMDRLRNFAAAKGLCVDVEKSEIWSGVDFVSVPDKVITVPILVGAKENFHVAERTDIAFYEILADPTIKTVVVENMSRLPVLCAEGIEFAMRAAGRSLLLASNVVKKISLGEMLDVVRELCEKHFDNSRTANYVAHRMLDMVKEYEKNDDPKQVALTVHECEEAILVAKGLDEFGNPLEPVPVVITDEDFKPKGHVMGPAPKSVSHFEVEQQSDDQAERDEIIMGDIDQEEMSAEQKQDLIDRCNQGNN